MDSLFNHVGLLVLPLLALRLAATLVNTEAGLRNPPRFRIVGPLILIVLLLSVSLLSLIAWIFYGLPDFRVAVAGNPLAVLLLFVGAGAWFLPIFRWFQRDWERLSHDRTQGSLPNGALFRGVPVEVGALMRVNLVVDEEGVHLAARGLEGIGCRPVCVTWGEFTSFQLGQRRGNATLEVALLDGSILGFSGEPALTIGKVLKERRP
jgi:hypothetical protein